MQIDRVDNHVTAPRQLFLPRKIGNNHSIRVSPSAPRTQICAACNLSRRFNRSNLPPQVQQSALAFQFEDTSQLKVASMADSDNAVTLRTRKFIQNPLLGRKQMVVWVLHHLDRVTTWALSTVPFRRLATSSVIMDGVWEAKNLVQRADKVLRNRDILHPGRANISKESLREKLGTMYKANKEQISVFGLRTQFGGGKTTGFALIYDSPEAMKKFEPTYRLVRVGMATKVERASRQQRMSFCEASLVCLLQRECVWLRRKSRLASTKSRLASTKSHLASTESCLASVMLTVITSHRQATQEPTEDAPRYGQGQGCKGKEGKMIVQMEMFAGLSRGFIRLSGIGGRLRALHFYAFVNND
jgi:small subunit ribosomal protein S24e